jgi:hypothetical protein
MQPFLKWIGKKRGLAESWMLELARVALAYMAAADWRIERDAELRIGWPVLSEADGRLLLDTVSWAHGAGVMGDEEARQALSL